MNIKLTCLAVIVVLFAYTAPGSAELLFTEDWEAETVGDQIDQLTQWNPRGGAGSIMQEAGGKFLRLNDPTPNNFSWVTSKEAFSFSQGNEMSLESDITLRSTGDKARIALREVADPQARYLLDVLDGEVQLHKQEGSITSGLIGSAGFSTGVGVEHTYLLHATHNGGDIDFNVFADGTLLFSLKDTTPILGTSDLFSVQLTTTGMVADFDNITLDVVPEPSSLNLLGVGVAGLLSLAWLRRRRTTWQIE